MFIDELAEELDRPQANVQMSEVSEQQLLQRRLRLIERTLEKLAARLLGPTEIGAGSKPGEEASKYQNVDTLLKYVDDSGADGGVKLVIMNFND